VTDGLLTREFRAATVGIVSLVSLVAFEAMAVATALPTAVRDLDGLEWYGWSFTALLVTSIVAMVAAGELADRVGPGPPLLAGVGLFLAGLVLAGAAPDMALFLAGRALQGAGTGLIGVILYVLIGSEFPEPLRPRAFGAVSAAWVVPGLVGPVVSGALAEGPGWRWVFLGLVPLVVAASTLLLPTLRRVGPPASVAPARPHRRLAAVGTAAGVAAVQWSLQDLGWARVPALLAGLGLLGAGLRVLLPAGTVGFRPGVPAVVGFRGLLAGVFFSVESLVPLTLSVVHGFSATAAGIPLSGGAVAWAAASVWQGRHPEVPRHRLVRAGAGLVALAAAGMAVVAQPWSPGWVVYLVWLVGPVGMGLAMSSVAVLLLAYSPEDERGTNSSAIQLSDAVCSALCIGLAGALVAASTRGLLPLSRAAGALDLLMAAAALGGVVLAARLRSAPQVVR
jgi:MFS family permease